MLLLISRWKEIAENIYEWRTVYCPDNQHNSKTPSRENTRKVVLERSTRIYKRITVRQIRFTYQSKHVVRVLKRHGHNVVRATFSSCNFLRLKDFVEILNSLPNLEYVVIDDCQRFPGKLTRRPTPDKLVNSKIKTVIIRASAHDPFYYAFKDGFLRGHTYKTYHDPRIDSA